MTKTKELTSAKRIPPQFTLAAAVVGLVIVSTSVSAQPTRGEVPQTFDDVFLPQVEGVEVETWVQNLQIPWSLVFLPNGDALVSERRGRIQRIPRGQNQPQLYIEIEEVADVGDGGLMGLALHPEFARQPFVYAMHSYHDDDQLFNRVVRLRHHGDTGLVDRS